MNGNLKFNKKGNFVSDGALFVVILLVLAIVAVVANLVQQAVNDDVQASDDMSEVAKNNSQQMTDRLVPTFDASFLMVFFILWIALIVSAFKINTAGWFFGIWLLITIIMFAAIPTLANSYGELISDPDLAASSVGFTLQTFILSHFFETFLVVQFTVVIALYMRGGF